jgi:hypothetical protein
VVNGVETIAIEKHSLEPYLQKTPFAPGGAVLVPQLELSTSSSWQQVASEYSRLADEKLRLADVQPMLSRIDLKNATRMETIQRLVSALHRNIRYTAWSLGNRRLSHSFRRRP